MSNWKPFFIKTNQVSGEVKDDRDWAEIRRKFDVAYSGSVWQLRQNETASKLEFGQRSEHQGRKTLGMFFDENNMERED